MALEDITHRDMVEKALKEFDHLGIDAMLKKYGRGPSTRWYVLFEGKCYDQKLILRAAHKLAGLGCLLSSDFKAKNAQRRLSTLGFTVTDQCSGHSG